MSYVYCDLRKGIPLRQLWQSWRAKFGHRIGAFGVDANGARVQLNLPTTFEQRMAEIVNLRIARKRAERDKAASLAAKNRLAHGVSRRERSDAAAERNKLRGTLDGHRIEPGDRR